MLYNRINIPTGTFLTTNPVESQTIENVSEGRLVARVDKNKIPKWKAIISLVGGWGGVLTDNSLFPYNWNFHMPWVMEKTRDSFPKKVPLCSRTTEGGKPAGSHLCCLQYELGSCATIVISIPETGASHSGWINPFSLDIYRNTFWKWDGEHRWKIMPLPTLPVWK